MELSNAMLKAFDEQVAERGSDVAYIWEREPFRTSLTWTAVSEEAERLRVGMTGDGPFSRYGVECVDEPSLIALLIAIWRQRGVVVPIDPQWGSRLREQVITHSGVTVLYDHPAGALQADWRRGEVAPFSPELPPLPPETAMISYTSGSTADPKGVMLSHDGLADAYRAGAAQVSSTLGKSPRRLACSMRVSGLGVLGMHFLLPVFLPDAETVVLSQLNIGNAQDYWSRIEAAEVDLTYLPPVLVGLLNQVASVPMRMKSDVWNLTGSAVLSAERQKRFVERFGRPLLNCYGLTEIGFTAFFGAMPDGEAASPSHLSIGVGGIPARIRDEGGLLLVGSGGGELELGGSTVALGYYRNEAATTETFEDGWLRTGDVVYRDEGGRYFITGRRKDAVMKGGFTVYLNETEEAAAELPGVADAGAVRLDDENGTEDIGLLVHLAAGSRREPSDLRRELQSRLGHGRAPRRVVIVRGPLPRNAMGKLDRRSLGDLWRTMTMMPIAGV